MKRIAIYLSIVLIDVVAYLILAFSLMNYEDSFDGSKGEFYSLKSMNGMEKVSFILLIAWYAINLVFIVFLLYHIWKRVKG